MPKQIKEKKKKIFFAITTNGFLFLKIFAIALMLLGIFADAVEVLSPQGLREQIAETLRNALKKYES